MMFFWLTLRQYINEKHTANIHGTEGLIVVSIKKKKLILIFVFIAHQIISSPDSYPRRLGRNLIFLEN